MQAFRCCNEMRLSYFRFKKNITKLNKFLKKKKGKKKSKMS